jgi:hypothetical protein
METSALTGNQVQQAIQILLQGVFVVFSFLFFFSFIFCFVISIFLELCCYSMLEIHKNKDIYSKMEKVSGGSSNLTTQDPSVKIRRQGRQGVDVVDQKPENGATESCC